MVKIIKRKYWLNRINNIWKKNNLIWLYGVRRVGKTYLCQSLDNIEYFDCELPRVRRFFEDPEAFFFNFKKENKKIVIDEIHRLDNPSEVLKIATDYFPQIKIIATGSSTLWSSEKFKDTLVGRKKDLWLTPIIFNELFDFGKEDLIHRLKRGGLPPFFLLKYYPERDFQDWLDGFWSKDISELFRLEKRHSFLKFCELIFSQSGGIFEATKFAAPCEVSRSSISNYLKVLEATGVAIIIRPFSSYKRTEIVSAPKVYAFDTGFVYYFKGWGELRNEDLGYLLEHFVLNEFCAYFQTRKIYYWRDKLGHEVDFVLLDREKRPIAIEVKWKEKDFDPKNLLSFRNRYPEGGNYVICVDGNKNFVKKYRRIKVRFLSLEELFRKFIFEIS